MDKFHPQTAAYRALNFVLRMILELTPCPMPRKAVKHNYFLYDKPAQTSAGASVYLKISEAALKLQTGKTGANRKYEKNYMRFIA